MLRLLGLVGDVGNPEQILQLAARLAPQFTRLKEDLPGLAHYLECFLLAPAALPALSVPDDRTSLPAEDWSGHKDLRGIQKPVSSLLRDYGEEIASKRLIRTEGRPLADDWLSICWLLRIIPPSPQLQFEDIAAKHDLPEQRLFECSFELPHFSLSSNEPGSAVRRTRLAEVGLEAWFQLFNKAPTIFSISGRAFGDILLRISRDPPVFPEFPLPITAEAVGLGLDERFLTQGHWEYPRPTQKAAIQQLLTQKAAIQQLPMPWLASPPIIEEMLIAISILTARAPNEVLALRVVGATFNSCQSAPPLLDSQAIVFSLEAGFRGSFYRAGLQILLRDGKSLRLPLPSRVGKVLKNLVGSMMAGPLLEFLPWSAIPWVERVELYLEHLMQCSRGCATRIVRDVMAREVFAQSRNIAVVAWLCPNRFADPSKRRGALPALASYLDPLGARTHDAYWKACGELFGALGATAEVGGSNCHRHGNYKVPISRHRAIAQGLRNLVEAPNLSEIEVHNAFVNYVLLMLIVATAHRKSNTPFWFSWDLRLDEKLAFICDKIVVGSEARFVPLADVVVEVLRAYQRHLVVLRGLSQNSHSAISAHIDSLQAQDRDDGSLLVSRTRAGHQDCGYFFHISAGGLPLAISTARLEASIRGIEGIATIGEFRPAIADALWGMGLDGTDVATFLGHSNDLHPFGPASIWSVQSWADRIRPFIQRYLDERDWRTLQSPLVKGMKPPHRTLRCSLPDFEPGEQSYEGRHRETLQARVRARKVVIQVLSRELAWDPNQKIDDTRLKEIRDRIETEFGSDRKARDAVLHVLTSEITALRGTKVTTTAATVNLLRLEPSPVGITFGRHLEIASSFREAWLSRVGMPIGGEMDLLERTAQLAISLVVHSAVLDPRRVMALAQAARGPVPGETYRDLVVIRGEIQTGRYNYEVAVAGDSITSALWMGIQRLRRGADEGPSGVDFATAELKDRVARILEKIMGRRGLRKSWNIADLCQLFSPWWFLRLPGYLYSISIGEHAGPAPHTTSEFSLLAELELPTSVAPSRPAETQDLDDPETGLKEATHEISLLLSRAGGRQEAGTTNTRRQRKELAKELAKLDGHPRLLHWIGQETIVEQVVGFIRHLLVEGGPREPFLRFNSIETYVRRVFQDLLREGWGQTMEEWTQEEFEDYYQRILDKARSKHPQLQAQLYAFHQYLRGSIDAPYVTTFPDQGHIAQTCRTSIVTVGARSAARELLANRHVASKELRDQVAALLGLGFDYGMRSAEAAGVEAAHFDSTEPKVLAVHKNVIRDLKTTASRRVIWSPCPNPQTTRILNVLRTRATSGSDSHSYLFGSAGQRGKVSNHGSAVRVARNALRHASANPEVVFHDSRATMATELTSALHPIAVHRESLIRAMSRVVRPELMAPNQILEITRAGPNNPFVVDAVARVLGHGSVETLLNVYFRTSFLAIAGHTFKASSDIAVTDLQLASMLGLSRSAISKQRSALASRAAHREISLDDLVVYSIGQLFVERMIPRKRGRRRATDDEDTSHPPHISWEVVDRLLLTRKERSLSMAEIMKLAEEAWGLDGELIAGILTQYTSVVCDAGFDDFEPASSDLVNGKPLRGGGVHRGRTERQKSLGDAYKPWNSNPKFRAALHRSCRCWFERVDSQKPRFSCRSEDELQDLLLVFDRLKVDRKQLAVSYSGTLTEGFWTVLKAAFPEHSIRAGERSSRGNRNVKVNEVGIAVRQLAGTAVGDGRDTHRLFAILYCCISADLMAIRRKRSTVPPTLRELNVLRGARERQQ